jgi:hypothetical protein
MTTLKAVRKIFRALQKGPKGGHFCITVAGKMQTVLVRTEINEALHTKAGLTIQIVDVGNGPAADTQWRETLAKKRDQHARLKAALEAAGWEVEQHFFILGRAGTCYTRNHNTMMDLGITKEQATNHLHKLHVHAVTKLREIVIARRRLERHQQGKPPSTLHAG